MNRIIRAIIILACVSIKLFAQTYSISGIVTSSDNEPLYGVNIIITGTGTGTSSKEDGSYILPGLNPGQYQLSFSFIGYKSEIRTFEITNSNVTLSLTMYEEAIQSGQVLVTAGKYEQRVSELPVSASIMPAEEIAKRNFINLDDIIRYIPGVNMTEDQVSIRGSSGYSRGAGTRVLMAIDGIPFYTGDTGEIIWDIVPVTQIQRVEIIKGAASSLYGSTAIGGVINVISNDISSEPQTYIKALAGVYSKPYYSEWDWSDKYRIFNGQVLAHSRKIDNFGFAASFTRLEDMGYKQSGFFHRYLGYLKASYDFSSSSSIKFFFNSINQRNGNFIYWKDSHNALIPPDEDQGQRIRTNRYMFGSLYRTVVNNNLVLDVKGSYYKTHWEDETTSANKSRTNLFRGEIQSTYSLNSSAVIVSGVEGSFTNVNSNLFGSPDSKSAGVYTQADIHFAFPLLISAGIRYDYSQLDSLEGYSEFSPKLGLNYTLSKGLIIRGFAGGGFRAPTLAETFTTTTVSGISVKPNPTLFPEKSLSFEGGVNYSFESLMTIDAALFWNEFYDFIEPRVDPDDGKIMLDNVVRARIQGYEVQADFDPVKNMTVSLNYTYLWTRDIEEEKALKYRPRHLAGASVNYKWFDIEAGADFRYWSKVEEIDYELIELGLVPDGEVRDDVFVLDLRAGYDLSGSGLPVRLNLTVNNILNYYYIELIGNMAPLRNFCLSAELVF